MTNGNPPTPPAGQASVTWPSAVVAVGVIGAVSAIAITAILHYPSVDDALKFWSALSGLIGIITGGVVTYFFSRGSVQSAQQQASTANLAAKQADQDAHAKSEALSVALLHVDPSKAEEIQSHPAIARALGT